MARIFITGSADGLGQMSAKILLAKGHQVVLHARNQQRAEDAIALNSSAETVLIGDLSSIAQVMDLARQANESGPFDAVIHNAAVGYRESAKITTADGLPHVFAINSLAPYLLTALIHRPKRLVYLSSGLHRDGDSTLKDLTWECRRWSGFQAYADSKLHNVLLAFAAASRWRDVCSNALEPGWVATKMGGPGAPDSLKDAPLTQVWLAASESPEALGTGGYYYHLQPKETHPDARKEDVQNLFLEQCRAYSGVPFPA